MEVPVTYTTVVATLKRLLKQRGLRYCDVADQIAMSESGLKKVLNADDGSFLRIEQICSVMGLTLRQVLLASQDESPPPLEFSAQVEQAFIDEPRLWFVLSELAVNGFDLRDVVELGRG